MEAVGAGLGDGGHVATRVAARRSIVHAGLDDEFLERVDGRDREIRVIDPVPMEFASTPLMMTLLESARCPLT